MDAPIPPAPAQAEPIPVATPAPVAPTPIAEALKAGDFTSYHASKRDANTATYVPDDAPAADPPAVETTPETPVVEPDTRVVSKRQQQINDYERRIAEQAQRIARLEAATVPPPAPRTEAQPAADAKPDPTDLTKYPEGHYSLNFMEDLSAWNARQVWTAADTKARDSQQQAQRTHAHAERKAAFVDRLSAADAGFVPETISPEVIGLVPVSELELHGLIAQAGPLNDVAEALMTSAVPVAVMRHFTEHPEDLRRFAGYRDRSTVLREFGKLEATLAAPLPPPVKTISSAPTPPPTLGTKPTDAADPVESAVARKDFPAYQAAKRARELAALKA